MLSVLIVSHCGGVNSDGGKQSLPSLDLCNSKENGNRARQAGPGAMLEVLRHMSWLVFVILKQTTVTWEEGT